ncbi:hypothetical protein Ccrd_021203 [Cynara cardunculus var. scolymus]|uniref:Uncharacterized protein n=1 Tax=Cynara cardunculus var. scolymus TaxID=59895 RepID=A0A103Y115_CYNCS|nr:hypothetical protein Ccrd_021203 [Cynara cardunculus var. scolymus]
MAGGAAGGFVTRAFESMLKECSGKKHNSIQTAIRAYLGGEADVSCAGSSLGLSATIRKSSLNDLPATLSVLVAGYSAKAANQEAASNNNNKTTSLSKDKSAKLRLQLLADSPSVTLYSFVCIYPGLDYDLDPRWITLASGSIVQGIRRRRPLSWFRAMSEIPLKKLLLVEVEEKQETY